MFNEIARTGKGIEEMQKGILTPLAKPGKKKGPPQNFRPVILLCTIRKIIALIMVDRIGQRIYDNIPITQAAYMQGRSTTEHIFTIKLLTEKAIITNNYEINFMLLDMSAAFDTIQRNKLMEDLNKIIDKDELHIIYVLIKDVAIQVRIGKELGENIICNIGAMQGDTFSAIAFISYLAKSIKPEKKMILIWNTITIKIKKKK